LTRFFRPTPPPPFPPPPFPLPFFFLAARRAIHCDFPPPHHFSYPTPTPPPSESDGPPPPACPNPVSSDQRFLQTPKTKKIFHSPLFFFISLLFPPQGVRDVPWTEGTTFLRAIFSPCSNFFSPNVVDSPKKKLLLFTRMFCFFFSFFIAFRLAPPTLVIYFLLYRGFSIFFPLCPFSLHHSPSVFANVFTTRTPLIHPSPFLDLFVFFSIPFP